MHLLIKYVIPIVLFFQSIGIIYAQKFSISPNDTIEITGNLEDLQTLTFNLTNISNDSVRIKWQKISEIVPVGWEVGICDNFFCNTSLVDSGTMLAISPNDYGFLLTHITPHINTGTATIKYFIWDITQQDTTYKLTYILHINENTGFDAALSTEMKPCFPNPTNSALTISFNQFNHFSYFISDSKGRIVLLKKAGFQNEVINTSNMANGLYYINYYKENISIKQEKFIIQH